MIQEPIYTKVSGELILPYASPTGTPIPIDKGKVIYKRGYVTPAGSYVAMSEQIVASIVDGVVEERSLLTGSVWRVTIEPVGVSYRHQFHFITEGESQNLSDVIPVKLDGLDYVRGESGTHIVSIETQEDQGLIRIIMSDGKVFTFPLPHAALDEADQAVLDSALESVRAGTATVEELASTLQANVNSTSADLQSNLQALADGVASVSSDRESIADDLMQAERAAGEASTSAQNALGHAEAAYGHSQIAKGAQSGAENALEELRTGIANGDFTGPAPTVEWSDTSLVVGGITGPSLKSTVPGPTGPPGAVLTPESMLVVGPGRPDAPTTTGMTSAALAALPVGAEYRSTDGASVGAWAWRKRPTGWVVTEGDTKWVDVGVITQGEGTCSLAVKRQGDVAFWKFEFDGALPAGSKNMQVTSLMGFRLAGRSGDHTTLTTPLTANPGNGYGNTYGTVTVLAHLNQGHFFPGFTLTAPLGRKAVGYVSYPVDDTWPTTLSRA